MTVAEIRCERCGTALRVGDFPFCPHAPTQPYRPFISYFDIGLGREITSLAQRNRVEHQTNSVARDTMSKGRISERLDKIRDAKREQVRRR